MIPSQKLGGSVDVGMERRDNKEEISLFVWEDGSSTQAAIRPATGAVKDGS